MILFSSALELDISNINTMKNLIIDAASNKIILTLINNIDVYSCSYDNSKSNFEKMIILIDEFLNVNRFSIKDVDLIYVNRGPGSFAGIRNSLSIVKALFLTKKIDYYCFSSQDFDSSKEVRHEDVPYLCNKFKVKKNLIKPLYLS